jgi:hypothetical protein
MHTQTYCVSFIHQELELGEALKFFNNWYRVANLEVQEHLLILKSPFLNRGNTFNFYTIFCYNYVNICVQKIGYYCILNKNCGKEILQKAKRKLYFEK